MRVFDLNRRDLFALGWLRHRLQVELLDHCRAVHPVEGGCARVVLDSHVPRLQERGDYVAKVLDHRLGIGRERASTVLDVVSGKRDSGLQNLGVQRCVRPDGSRTQLLAQEFARLGRGFLGEYRVLGRLGLGLVLWLLRRQFFGCLVFVAAVVDDDSAARNEPNRLRPAHAILDNRAHAALVLVDIKAVLVLSDDSLTALLTRSAGPGKRRQVYLRKFLPGFNAAHGRYADGTAGKIPRPKRRDLGKPNGPSFDIHAVADLEAAELVLVGAVLRVSVVRGALLVAAHLGVVLQVVVLARVREHLVQRLARAGEQVGNRADEHRRVFRVVSLQREVFGAKHIETHPPKFILGDPLLFDCSNCSVL